MTTLARLETANQNGLNLVQQVQQGGLGTILELAGALADNDVLPKHFRENKANLLVAFLAAQELGVGFMGATQNFFIVNGKLTMYADFMVALTRNAGHLVRHEQEGEGNQVKMTTIIVRKEDRERHSKLEDQLAEVTDPARVAAIEKLIAKLEHRATWGFDEVKAALLTSDKADANHNKYRRTMRRHRADAECIRMACPEILGAYKYTPEEMGAKVDEDGAPVEVTVERADRPAPASPKQLEPGPVDITSTAVVASSAATAQGIYDKATTVATKEQLGQLLNQAVKANVANGIVKTDSGKRGFKSAMSALSSSLA